MAKTIKLKKGFNINLAGKAEKKLGSTIQPETYALKPSDFQGMYMPKVVVKEGDTIKAGTPIFYDKGMEKAMYCSPVSGEVAAVVRGDKRKLLEVRILADKQVEYLQFQKYSVSDLVKLSKEDALARMLEGGVWPQIIQRPYGVVANPADSPKSIFISGFDTHPLAPDYGFIFKDQEKYLQAGIDVLAKFTKKIHFNLNGDGEIPSAFAHIKNAEINKVSGKHPAGCVGVQIHHIEPINKGEVVWTLNPYGVIQIGKLFLEGVYDASKTIALVGSSVKTPQYYKTYMGASVKKFLDKNLNEDNVRVISGNVLTGESIGKDGYLGYYDHQITVIPEGNHARFFLTEGWLAPTSRLSYHRAFGLMSFLSGSKEKVMDTNANGEERAFVITGAFEDVTPMDILPTYLVKAVLSEDLEEMEALGILEVVEEDLALCEFIDVSKHPIQEIIRKGINLMKEA
jgi:Na+-transporting NADH:ubiquinone oxidoreductase subunit A